MGRAKECVGRALFFSFSFFFFVLAGETGLGGDA